MALPDSIPFPDELVDDDEALARLLGREVAHKPEANAGASIGFTAPLEHA